MYKNTNNYLTVLIILISLLSCAPQTRFRREALVPSPQPPPYRGETLGKGHVEIQAQVAGSHIEEETYPNTDFFALYDDALWVPEFMLNASALFGVINFLDIGGLFSYAHGSWAKRSAEGTPPMTDDGKHVFAIGPQIGAGGKFFGGKFFFGGYTSIQYVRIPWSEWEAVDVTDPNTDCYRMNDKGNDNDIYYRFAIYAGFRPTRWFAVNGGVVIHAAWKNIGFSNEDYSGSTLDQTSPLIMPLIGMRFDIKPVFLETFLTFPISTYSEISYFPLGWSAGIGLKI